MITAPAFWVFAAIILVGGLWGLWITLERLFSQGSCCVPRFGGSSSDRKPLSNSTTVNQRQIQQAQAKGKQRQLGEEDSRHVRWQQHNGVVGGGGGGGGGAGGDRGGHYDEERNVGMMEMQRQRGGPTDRPWGAMR